MYHKLTKKLFNLFSGELAATIIFAGVWLMFLNIHEGTKPYLTSFAPLFAFLLLEFLLLQGSYYWYLKWRQAKRRDFSILPEYQLKLFRGLKRMNLFLLGVGFVLVIYELISYRILVSLFISFCSSRVYQLLSCSIVLSNDRRDEGV